MSQIIFNCLDALELSGFSDSLGRSSSMFARLFSPIITVFSQFSFFIIYRFRLETKYLSIITRRVMAYATLISREFSTRRAATESMARLVAFNFSYIFLPDLISRSRCKRLIFRCGIYDSDLGNFLLHLCNEVEHGRAFYDADRRARFTTFPDTLLFTLRDSFTDCIETFSATRVSHSATYHVARSVCPRRRPYFTIRSRSARVMAAVAG